MHGVAWLVLLAACGGARPSDPPANVATDHAGSAADPARRCLPVVTSQCGCSYPCAIGERTAAGGWAVRYAPIWKDSVLVGKIAPWCVDGACTDAFDVELVCGGICAPKPADPTCRFVGDRCVGRDAP